jgi:SAM-dependent methyltransferase
MHENNRRWLTDLRRHLPEYFTGARVLEIGSRIVSPPPCDTVRQFFTDCTYLGVDRSPGPGVDVVCDARELALEPGDVFDTLLIFSVFEHDPHWRETLARALLYLRTGGLLLVCFGAEGNLHHAPEPWAPVPHAEFLDYAASLPLDVVEWFFEEECYGKDCAGAFDVRAFKR